MAKIECISELEALLPPLCIEQIALPGDNSSAVYHWLIHVQFSVLKEVAIDILAETGGWNRVELKRMVKRELKARLLWLAAHNAKENNDTRSI